MILNELRTLEDNIFHCNKCTDLIVSRLYPMPGFSGDDIKLMVIGINPGPPQRGEHELLCRLEGDYRKHYEIGIRNCLIGKFMDKALIELKINWNNVYFTNIIKCATPNVRLPNEEEIANCKPYIIKQIHLIEPPNFLLLGKLPITAFGLDINLMEVKTFNSQVISIPHPTYIRRKGLEKEVLSFLSSIMLKETRNVL